MSIKQFITANGLRQADVVIVQKEKFGIFDHFVVFLGYHRQTAEPIFAANYGDSVRLIPLSELERFLKTYTPVSIRRFKGTESDRTYAVERAREEINSSVKRGYHLIVNNCEHFANWVQKGVRNSEQVRKFGNGTALAGLGLAATGVAAKKDSLVAAGLAISIFGLITSLLSED